VPIDERCNGLDHPVGVLSTQISNSLAILSRATFCRQIRDGVLKSNQFNATLKDADGEIHKPSAW
jgi:hypothetical protein